LRRDLLGGDSVLQNIIAESVSDLHLVEVVASNVIGRLELPRASGPSSSRGICRFS